MSFIRKFVSKWQLRKRSSGSVGEDTDAILPNDSLPESSTRDNSALAVTGQTDERTDRGSGGSRSATSLSSEDGVREIDLSLSVLSLDRKLRKKRKTLNKKLDKYRLERWRVEQKAAHVEHLQGEISALMAMLSRLKKQKDLLGMEKNNKLREMALACKLVSEDVSPELRKKEPLQFKKYHSAKTMTDVQNLLQNIHLKQRALQHLEVLAFKKLLDLEHKGLSSLAKNNNNTAMADGMEMLMEDILTRFDNCAQEEPQINFPRQQFYFQTTALINSVGILPPVSKRHVTESLV